MTTRERVIVGVSAVVVLLGGGYYGLDGVVLSGSSGEGAAVGADQAEAFVRASEKQLADVAVTDVERKILSAAHEDWDGHPFADAPVVDETVVVEAPVDQTFRYSGFVQAGGRRFAIINGKEYAEHDVLAGDAGEVRVIEPDYVILRVGPDGRRQVIPLNRQLQPGER